MSDLLPGLIVLAFGGSIAPPLLLLTVLFLGSRRPLPNAAALALGYFGTCAAIGAAALALFSGTTEAGGASMVGRVSSAAVGGLLVVLAFRSLLNVPDPDTRAPRWMESISSMTPARAFGFGVALFPVQIKNLAVFVACLDLIAEASLGHRGNTVAFVLVLAVFALPFFVLVGLYTAVPRRASTMLGSLRAWMEKNGRAITVVLCFAVGTFFLARGVSGM